MLARGMVGLGEGVALPSMNNLVANNIPLARRSTALGGCFSGFHTGPAACLLCIFTYILAYLDLIDFHVTSASPESYFTDFHICQVYNLVTCTQVLPSACSTYFQTFFAYYVFTGFQTVAALHLDSLSLTALTSRP